MSEPRFPTYRAGCLTAVALFAAFGDLTDAVASVMIDASGLYVAPGFIDAHSYAGDGLATSEVELAHAIRSMTSLPAQVFPVADRGVLRAGAYAADVVF